MSEHSVATPQHHNHLGHKHLELGNLSVSPRPAKRERARPVTVEVVKLSPQYDQPSIVSSCGFPGDQAVPLARQRRRLEQQLAALSEHDWEVPSRCDAWTIKDVVAHLASVNRFWTASANAGLAGTPTRLLGGFDPAATPSLMVDSMGPVTPAEVLEMFVSTNDALLAAVAELDDQQWMVLAESPVGHVPLRLVMQHALWDSWVHERDISLPLGLPAAAEPDELRSCLQYSAAVSPALALASGHGPQGTFAVRATDLRASYLLKVDSWVMITEDSSVGAADTSDAAVPCLSGDAVELVEALSMRGPLPASAPHEWHQLLGGLAAAFDAVPDAG